jgi:hypothetical protein
MGKNYRKVEKEVRQDIKNKNLSDFTVKILTLYQHDGQNDFISVGPAPPVYVSPISR